MTSTLVTSENKQGGTFFTLYILCGCPMVYILLNLATSLGLGAYTCAQVGAYTCAQVGAFTFRGLVREQHIKLATLETFTS
jgi:hypothetical protein